mmetsp:Transcript_10886/g.21335  ORF Transcript_10886/g.21335 Transcript_10886/m.21335 type:complete len:82 (+) Transcript_10886:5423-5668(+)
MPLFHIYRATKKTRAHRGGSPRTRGAAASAQRPSVALPCTFLICSLSVSEERCVCGGGMWGGEGKDLLIPFFRSWMFAGLS